MFFGFLPVFGGVFTGGGMIAVPVSSVEWWLGAGFGKRVTPQLLRHSRATFLASRITEA